jgi:hypothetical protein
VGENVTPTEQLVPAVRVAGQVFCEIEKLPETAIASAVKLDPPPFVIVTVLTALV